MKEFDPGRQCRLHRLGHRPGAPGRDRRAGHLPCIFSATRAAFVGAEENVALVERRRRDLARRGAWRRHPVRGVGRQAHRHGRRRRQGRRARCQRRGRDARHRRKTALDRQCRAASRRRGGVVGRQDRVRPRRQGRGEIVRSALDRRRACVRAEGAAARDRALQRRDAVVSQHGGEAEVSGMGRLASRRDVQPRQQVSGHRHARAGAARLAARRQPAHAHDRLSRPRALDVMERGRQGRSPPPAPTP